MVINVTKMIKTKIKRKNSAKKQLKMIKILHRIGQKRSKLLHRQFKKNIISISRD